jgi:hypothetical protein
VSASTLDLTAARQRKPRVAVTTPDGRPAWYPEDAVLTLDDVAAVLKITVKSVRAVKGLRVAYFTPQRPYVLYRWLVEYLEAQAG